ncbi:MAG: myo-inosose-2 dehydratase [Myxococcota bacterium]
MASALDRVKLGVSPILWSNDDLPELGADVSLEQCLTEARRSGFEGIEMGHKFPRDPQSLRRVLTTHRLRLASGWFGTQLMKHSVDEEMQRLEPLLRRLEAAECPLIQVAEMTGAVHRDRSVPVHRRPVLHPEGVKIFGESMTLLAEALEARGFRLCYHHHIGTVVESEEDLDALVEHSGESLGLTLDTGHALFAGFDPMTPLQKYRERVMHVHLKELRPGLIEGNQRMSFLDAVVEGAFTVPGDGRYDFAAFLRELTSTYRGWLIVEADQDPSRADPFVYANMGRNCVRRWLS